MALDAESAIYNPQLLPSEAADLAANRAGRISDRQRGALVEMEAQRQAVARITTAGVYTLSLIFFRPPRVRPSFDKRADFVRLITSDR